MGEIPRSRGGFSQAVAKMTQAEVSKVSSWPVGRHAAATGTCPVMSIDLESWPPGLSEGSSHSAEC